MLKFSWINLRKEMEEIELIPDEVEKATRYQLINIVIEKINEYNEHISNYEYVRKKQEIINRGIVYISRF